MSDSESSSSELRYESGDTLSKEAMNLKRKTRIDILAVDKNE